MSNKIYFAANRYNRFMRCKLFLLLFLGYSEYDVRNGFPFSQRRIITVSEKKKLNVELRFKQVAFNETLSFPFGIPKNYRRG